MAIVHPREVWSTGIASLVRSRGFEVIGQWSTLEPALAELLKAPPHILILSKRIIDRSCKTSIGELRQRLSTIVVLEPEETLAAEDLRDFSFEGLLISDAPARVFESCLHAVAAGHGWIDPTFLRYRAAPSHGPDWRCLSDRELEVARLSATGLSNKRIAKALGVSDGTVKMHMHHILAKLHLERRGDLVLALVHGSPLLRSGGLPTAARHTNGKLELHNGTSPERAGGGGPPGKSTNRELQANSAGECPE